MKPVLALIFLVILSGCMNNPKQSMSLPTHPVASSDSSSTPISSPSSAPSSMPISSPTSKSSTLNEADAKILIESKLSEESLRVTSIRYDGEDEDGNYIFEQSSQATTEVMEWYHVNPASQEITCEIMTDSCLLPEDDESDSTIELTPDQQKALEMAQLFAKDILSKSDDGYVEGLTYIEFDEEREGEFLFHVWNPGLGGTDTVDWLRVNLEQGLVSSDRHGDENISIEKTNEQLNHPTKEVFVAHSIQLDKVSFADKQKTYPIFYVSTKDGLLNYNFLQELSKANGYWNFTISNKTSKSNSYVDMKVTVDRNKHRVVSSEIGTTKIEYYPYYEENVEKGFEIVRKKLGWADYRVDKENGYRYRLSTDNKENGFFVNFEDVKDGKQVFALRRSDDTGLEDLVYINPQDWSVTTK